VERINQRQGFLVSAVIHLTLLMILVSAEPTLLDPRPADPEELEKRELVFLPRPEVLRQLAPPPPEAARPRPAPAPAPTPPPSEADPDKKDRISIGPPAEVRKEGPMILRRDDDLTKVRKGEPTLPPEPAAPAARPRPTPPPQVAERGSEAEETPGRPGLRLPPGLMGPPTPAGEQGRRQGSPGISESMDEAIDDVSRRIARDSQLGIPTGTGQTIEGLRFDPRGADFTLWINHFKNQVYRNWIVPQTALLGFSGHVDFEFTLERDGSMSALRMLKSSGTSSLDRAARNALTASRFMSLPDDYGPPRVTMQVTFYYNEAPRGS
jgi:TonB family protein